MLWLNRPATPDTPLITVTEALLRDPLQLTTLFEFKKTLGPHTITTVADLYVSIFSFFSSVSFFSSSQLALSLLSFFSFSSQMSLSFLSRFIPLSFSSHLFFLLTPISFHLYLFSMTMTMITHSVVVCDMCMMCLSVMWCGGCALRDACVLSKRSRVCRQNARVTKDTVVLTAHTGDCLSVTSLSHYFSLSARLSVVNSLSLSYKF